MSEFEAITTAPTINELLVPRDVRPTDIPTLFPPSDYRQTFDQCGPTLIQIAELGNIHAQIADILKPAIADDIISEEEIQAHRYRDSRVRLSLTQSALTLTTANEGLKAYSAHIKSESQKSILDTERTSAEILRIAEVARDQMIAAVVAQFEKYISDLSLETNGLISEHERVIETHDVLESESEFVGSKISGVIDSTIAQQSEHETNRNSAINIKNNLLNRQHQLESDLSTAIAELAVTTNERVETEKAKDLLFKEKEVLIIREHNEWEQILTPYKSVLMMPPYNFQVDSDEFKKALEEIKLHVPKTIDLQTTATALDDLKEDRKSNKERFEELTTKIGWLNLSIKKITDELESIPNQIADVENILLIESQTISTEIDKKSSTAVFVTDTFSNIIQGELDAVAEKPLPNALLSLYDNKVASLQALNIVKGLSPLNLRPLPNFDPGTTILNESTQDEPYPLQRTLERIRTVAHLKEELSGIRRIVDVNFVRALSRKIKEPRKVIQYEHNGKTE